MFDPVDDGTIDTVLECSKCGKELRFDSASLLDADDDTWADVDEEYLNDRRIERAIEEAEWSHECEERR